MGPGGPDDRPPVRDDGVGELGEEHRSIGRGDALLGDVVAVVQADADDLARVDGGGRSSTGQWLRLDALAQAALDGALEPSLPALVEPDLVGDPHVGGQRRQAAEPLELSAGQEAVVGDDHPEPVAVEAVDVGVQAHPRLRSGRAGRGGRAGARARSGRRSTEHWAPPRGRRSIAGTRSTAPRSASWTTRVPVSATVERTAARGSSARPGS